MQQVCFTFMALDLMLAVYAIVPHMTNMYMSTNYYICYQLKAENKILFLSIFYCLFSAVLLASSHYD